MDWLYDGVNKTVARNAGPECANFLSPRWRFIESVIVLCAVSLLFLWSYQKVTLPTQNYVKKDRIGKVILLILMSIVWGMEIGYKFSSRTVIYLLNPCHVTTAIQVKNTNTNGINFYVLFFPSSVSDIPVGSAP